MGKLHVCQKSEFYQSTSINCYESIQSSHKPRLDQPNRKLSPGQSDFYTLYFFKTTITV